MVISHPSRRMRLDSQHSHARSSRPVHRLCRLGSSLELPHGPFSDKRDHCVRQTSLNCTRCTCVIVVLRDEPARDTHRGAAEIDPTRTAEDSADTAHDCPSRDRRQLDQAACDGMTMNESAYGVSVEVVVVDRVLAGVVVVDGCRSDTFGRSEGRGRPRLVRSLRCFENARHGVSVRRLCGFARRAYALVRR